MSKSPSSNILFPAIGGTALLLGGAFGVANIDHGGDRIEALQVSVAQERAATKSQAARTAELEASLAALTATTQEQAAAAEAQASEAEQAIAALQAQLQSASNGAPQASVVAAPANTKAYGIGRVAVETEIIAWDVDVLPDGRGLPEGSGDVTTGDEVFGEKCASCHGDFAEGRDAWPVLAGGFDTLDDRDPVKTVGSYWPYLSTVWDYVHRSMPFGSAGTLTDDEVYAITAYILYSNDLVDDDFVLSRDTFADVEMYNTDGFIVDDRATAEYAIWTGEPCMNACKDAPAAITRRSSDVGVTPADDGSMVESPMEMALVELGGTEWGAERVAGSVFMDPNRMAADEATHTQDAESTQEATNTAPEEPSPTPAGLDPALVAAGEKVFRKCKSCHQVGEGATNRSGPLLNGVFGRLAGSVDGFKYSNAFKKASADGLSWTDEALAEFLADPRGYLKGTRMSFRGLKSEADIAAVTAYLASFAE